MPHIETYLQIGEQHLNHCEDYFFVGEIGDKIKVLAVCDGCTFGKESWFASVLFVKFLRKICRELHYLEMYQADFYEDLADLEKQIMQRMFREVASLQGLLFLEQEELLSTLLLCLVNEETGVGHCLAVGDGLLCIDGETHDFDQDNKPDYLGLHLAKGFDKWCSTQQQRVDFTCTQYLLLATDGIFSFDKTKLILKEEAPQVLDFLTSDFTESMRRRVLFLKEEYALMPMDDLAMVRWCRSM